MINKITQFFQQPCRGRLGRAQFLIGFLICGAVVPFGLVFSKTFQQVLPGTKESWIVYSIFLLALIIAILFFFISMYITWSLYIRRLHDVGVSGWFIIIIMILSLTSIVLGTFLILSLFFVPGKKSVNKYGEQAKSLNVKQILFNNKNDNKDLTDTYIDVFLFIAVLVTIVHLILNNFSR